MTRLATLSLIAMLGYTPSVKADCLDPLSPTVQYMNTTYSPSNFACNLLNAWVVDARAYCCDGSDGRLPYNDPPNTDECFDASFDESPRPGRLADYHSGSCDGYTPTCGDGLRGFSEECDDGNMISGDGCSASCEEEHPGSCVEPYYFGGYRAFAEHNSLPLVRYKEPVGWGGLSACGGFDQVEGNSTGDYAGRAVVLGDFNGDGFEDLATGIPGASNREGKIEIRYGSDVGLAADPDFVLDQQGGGGPAANNEFGSVLAVGDFNNDTYDDLVVGVPLNGSGTGIVEVFFGTDQGFTVNSPVSDLESSSPAKGKNFGFSLAVGDFDDDGNDDLAIGAPMSSDLALRAGEVTITFGQYSSTTFTNQQTYVQEGGSAPDEDDRFGHALAAGDFDDDGFDDLAVGSPGEKNGNSTADVGLVSILWGDVVGPQQTQQTGVWATGAEDPAAPRMDTGRVLAAGDLDSDGTDDLIIGVPMANVGMITNTGLIEIAWGNEFRDFPLNQRARIDQEGFGGTLGVGDEFPHALITTSIDDDDVTDLIGTTGNKSVGGVSNAGALLIGYGDEQGRPTSEFASHEVRDASEFMAPMPEDRMGYVGPTGGTPLTAGDIDGDGVPEVMVGIPNRDLNYFMYNVGAVVAFRWELAKKTLP